MAPSEMTQNRPPLLVCPIPQRPLQRAVLLHRHSTIGQSDIDYSELDHNAIDRSDNDNAIDRSDNDNAIDRSDNDNAIDRSDNDNAIVRDKCIVKLLKALKGHHVRETPTHDPVVVNILSAMAKTTPDVQSHQLLEVDGEDPLISCSRYSCEAGSGKKLILLSNEVVHCPMAGKPFTSTLPLDELTEAVFKLMAYIDKKDMKWIVLKEFATYLEDKQVER